MKVCRNFFPASLVTFLCCLLGSSACATTNVTISSVPEWVRLADATAAGGARSSAKSNGVRYLLYEIQENPAVQEEFTRVVVALENETGVQDYGTLSFHFDPSYQDLLLHRVQVLRNGRALDRLEPAKLRVIQPERSLGADILTGDHNAVLIVEDLRVGDTLEYSFTTRGLNPVMGNHYSTRIAVQSSAPVDRQRVRIVWSGRQPLAIRQHITQVQPHAVSTQEKMEYTWDFTNVVEIAYEDYLPDGFEAFPYVEASDFGNWGEVVNWALPLYHYDTNGFPPELEGQISQWRAGDASLEERALLALEFVQDELRYTGLELGPDSYRPTPPGETFQKRFGDCKGKSLLLCAILRALGVEAWPALVNTYRCESVERGLPSATAFNHVIVKIRVGGQVHWVDPTLSHQGGRLADRYVPPVRKALVIQAGVAAFEDVPPPGERHARQEVFSTFKISDYVSPVAFTVRTVFHGGEADSMRERVARTAAAELAEDYLNYYSRNYPEIQSLQPVQFDDDRKQNVLTTTEHYLVTNLWVRSSKEGRNEASFYAEGMNAILTDPTTRRRKFPLAIRHPLHRSQQINVHLPDKDWDIPAMEETVEHEAFVFNYRRKANGNLVQYFYECRTRLPRIEPEQTSSYLQQVEKFDNLLGDSLLHGDEGAGAEVIRLNWLMLVVTGFWTITVTAGCLWLWFASRPNPSRPPLLPLEPQLQGLQGWLILVAIGLCVAPFTRLIAVGANWDGFFTMASWEAVTNPQSKAYHPFFAPLLIFELLANIFLLALNGLALALFFGRRRLFPKIYIALLCCNASILALDEVWGAMVTTAATQVTPAEADGMASSRDLFRAVLTALIWSAYTLKSRRVKSTFLR